MTPKQRVLKKYPKAVSCLFADGWYVYTKGAGGDVIGQARSVVIAWKLAAMRIYL